MGFFLVVVAGRKTPVVSDQQRQKDILVLTGRCPPATALYGELEYVRNKRNTQNLTRRPPRWNSEPRLRKLGDLAGC